MAERDGLVMRNVAGLSKAVKVPTTDIKVLDPGQVKVFQAAIAGDRLEALYLVTLGLGLRQGEALGLTWDSLDLDGARLRVSQALQYRGGPSTGAPVLVAPKSERSKRTLDLPGVLVEALRRHRVRQSRERLAAGWHWSEEWNLVFCTERGEPLKPWRVLRDFKVILVRAELPVIRFQDLRHSAASLLLLHGVPTRMVADILGHSSVSLTQQTYQHVLPQLREQAVKAQEAYLGSG